MRGQNNKVDHNALIGKTNEGPALVVRLDAPGNVNNNHLIARNFFGYRVKTQGEFESLMITKPFGIIILKGLPVTECAALLL